MHQFHLLVMQHSINSEDLTHITLTAGIDEYVWSLNVNHFKKQEIFEFNDSTFPTNQNLILTNYVAIILQMTVMHLKWMQSN